MAHIDVDIDRLANPVDTIEQLATINDWSFERSGEDDIAISVSGTWADYSVSISWMDDVESLHIACSFDLKVPDNRQVEVLRLLNRINEGMWIGHFDIWSEQGSVMYRHSLLLSGGAEANDRQCEALLETALEACERHYQAFQFVVWAGKTTDEALAAVLFDTMGEA
ncbi:hypothetical protein GCM10007276_16840 [Agaricicola taiwanensis]|uniref:YbjN domain-containing protein n=1 Tax=Agaricicola taiwanensis TaxID=591372 RepID=A0A8J2VNA9_9RHOB|nr:YbjN domain-containing protein [Agaricicola taiwanensis]GGE40167.1 hypothetical protein GCM10007276_16840 [Agaricicola taiwanensis]